MLRRGVIGGEGPGSRPWRPWRRGLLGLALLGVLLLGVAAAGKPARAAVPGPIEQRYCCDGDLLLARIDNGAVDAAGIPNTVAGTPPGAFVLLEWRGLRLQLPRTNNAGAPSFTDGRWWWALEDPEHPTLVQRRAEETRFPCRRLPGASSPAP